ncbi:MAG: hypothetical protein ACYC33_06990 [Thermoleophilia bacterium]
MSDARPHPPHVPTAQPPSLEELIADLRVVVRRGLPLSPVEEIPAILALRGVWARSVNPGDELAGFDAADRLLRAQFKRITLPKADPAQLVLATQRLFGTSGTRGQDLTHRRLEAAQALGYDPDHFRKRIEPRIVEQLAWQLHQDSLQYVPRVRHDPPPEASGDTPSITEEDISDPERAKHQILLSRIWSEVYALRAELISRELHRGKVGQEVGFGEAQSAAELVLGNLLLHLDEYFDRYGKRILHGEAEYNADALIRLAGWSGELTEAQVRELKWEATRRARKAGDLNEGGG